jgi:hypothetical protein
MADIEVVIKIPEEEYKRFVKAPRTATFDECISDRKVLVTAIANGTPLPKGHGRILDEKNILDIENNSGGWYDLVDMPEYIAGVKAIIVAESEVQDADN